MEGRAGGGGAGGVLGDLQSGSDSVNHQGRNRKLIGKARKFICGRLFKINHVLLSDLPVTPKFYHLMILFDFLQIIFYVFFNVNITNEFAS